MIYVGYNGSTANRFCYGLFFSLILKLDRHLRRLDNDLDKVHDETRNESRSPQSMVPTRQASPINTLKLPLAEMIGEGSQRKRKLKLMLAYTSIY